MREVELLLNQQAELADVTGNIAHIKQKIKHLENLDENSQVRLHFRCSLYLWSIIVHFDAFQWLKALL